MTTDESASFYLAERTGSWADALRTRLAGRAIRWIETRNLEECGERIVQWPAALVGLELTEANGQRLLEFLTRLEREFPSVRALVFADRRLAGLHNLFREAGAIHFVVSPHALSAVADMVERRQEQPLKLPDQREAEFLLELPWADA